MKKVLFIAAGGCIGAILRYVIGEAYSARFLTSIPFNTLFINLAGCFLLALILTETFELLELNTDLRLGITTGLLGAFTTFSTFCKETVNLIYSGHFLIAALYFLLSAALGFAAAYAGFIVSRSISARRLAGIEKRESRLKKGKER